MVDKLLLFGGQRRRPGIVSREDQGDIIAKQYLRVQLRLLSK